jgi:lactate dehydrogenase-like 2-hydroxyacid dehydrogenase
MEGGLRAASPAAEAFIARARSRDARLGIIGLGYVGLPLARAACERGFRVVGFDIDPAKVDTLNGGGSYIRQIAPAVISDLIERGLFTATADFDRLAESTRSSSACRPRSESTASRTSPSSSARLRRSRPG